MHDGLFKLSAVFYSAFNILITMGKKTILQYITVFFMFYNYYNGLMP